MLAPTPRQLYPLHFAHYTTAHPGPRVASQPGQTVGSYKDVGSMSTWEPWINRSYLQESLHQIFIARILTYLHETQLHIHFRRLSSGGITFTRRSAFSYQNIFGSINIMHLQNFYFPYHSQIHKLARNTRRFTRAPLQETNGPYFLLRYSLRNTISQPHQTAKLKDALKGRSKKSTSSIGTWISL